MPFANIRIDFPRLDVSGSTGVALSQLLRLAGQRADGTFPRFDMIFSYAFYAPTGRYTAGAANNTGLGMWCNEFSLRGTAFFDAAKNWHASLSTFFDINGKKQDLDWKTGNPLTLMYGLRPELRREQHVCSRAGSVLPDTLSGRSPTRPVPMRLVFVRRNRTEVYGIGPELAALQGALTVRYFWQFGGKFTTRGSGLYVQFAMPL